MFKALITQRYSICSPNLSSIFLYSTLMRMGILVRIRQPFLRVLNLLLIWLCLRTLSLIISLISTISRWFFFNMSINVKLSSSFHNDSKIIRIPHFLYHFHFLSFSYPSYKRFKSFLNDRNPNNIRRIIYFAIKLIYLRKHFFRVPSSFSIIVFYNLNLSIFSFKSYVIN